MNTPNMNIPSPKTHAMNMSAALRGQGREGGSADLPACLETKNLNLYYGATQALFNVSVKIPKSRVTAFIGPSGCGKSTLLRCFNRMNDLVDICRIEGQILLDNADIHDRAVKVALLRRRVGMVFQKPNPFPKSIFENVAYGLRIMGINDKTTISETVEKALRGAALWDEVKDRLDANGLGLSGGQQQRLVIARAIALEPDRYRESRRVAAGAQRPLHHRHRHPQHAAGGSRFRLHPVHAHGRSGRVQ